MDKVRGCMPIWNNGVSRRQVMRETGMHWKTLAKILTHSEPPAPSRGTAPLPAHPTNETGDLSPPPRGHREVENQLCLVVGAVFGGDQSRDHNDHCAANPNLTPRLSWNLLRINAPTANCGEGKRLNAAVKSN